MLQNGSASKPQCVVIYARVSSKEQELEGFSIPAHLDLLRDYARKQSMEAVQEFVDVESASTSGRTGFGQMLAFLKKNRSKCQTILVEKTDRLYRNVSDYATVDELGVTIHFVKDGTILSPDSKSSEQFIHGIKVLMARNYSQNLGEETLKGMLQKAKSGLYPSNAPAGYRNVEGADGRRIIVPDNDPNDYVSVCGVPDGPLFPEDSRSKGEKRGMDGWRPATSSEHSALDPSQAHLHRRF